MKLKSGDLFLVAWFVLEADIKQCGWVEKVGGGGLGRDLETSVGGGVN